MKIKKIIKYSYNSNIFNSLEEIQKYIDNKIGSIIDNIDVTLTPSQKLKIHEAISIKKDSLIFHLEALNDLENNLIEGD